MKKDKGQEIMKFDNLSDEGLAELTQLVNALITALAESCKLATQLEESNVKVKKYSETYIPEKLASLGLEQIRLKDGKKIIVEEFYSGMIKEDDRPRAFKWLEENGFGNIIKKEVHVPIRRDDLKMHAMVMRLLSEAKLASKTTETIHGQTLKAFIREQVEAKNKKLPWDLFNIYIGKRTKIT